MALNAFVAGLPPLGRLTFAAAWPAAGVPEGTLELDAAPILRAAARAQVLLDLPERPPPDRDVTGWAAYRPTLSRQLRARHSPSGTRGRSSTERCSASRSASSPSLSTAGPWPDRTARVPARA